MQYLSQRKESEDKDQISIGTEQQITPGETDRSIIEQTDSSEEERST
jgi:hypothetical protein